MHTRRTGHVSSSPDQMDSATIADHYRVSRSLLVAEVDRAIAGPPVLDDVLANIGTLCDSFVAFDDTGKSLAKSAGELFAAFAFLCGSAVTRLFVERCNDHLYFVRRLDCQDVESASTELTRLCEMAIGQHFIDLRTAIAEYHDTRPQLLSHRQKRRAIVQIR